ACHYLAFQKLLRGVADLERIVARISLKTARPRDLAQLRETLTILPEIKAALCSFPAPLLQELAQAIADFSVLQALLQKAIVDNPPVVLREGGVIARGYDRDLDELLSLRENAGDFLLQLEAQEKERTQLSTLKVGYNRVHGYYIELSRGQAERAPPEYLRRQTLKNAERYITPELKVFEEKALSSREKALAREKQLYEALLESCLSYLLPLQAAAASIAELDVLSNFAERAEELRWSCPLLTKQPGIHLLESRHPVIEFVSDQAFVPNDVRLSAEERMFIITGPNMGGKSTYMRQIALIVLLAHLGSFVPAKEAQIGAIDRIFTRIGAADDLAGGRSTFMVEMTETANILHQATEQSLVLMDEIGRGTSTLDGLSLAFAAAEYLAQNIKAFCLFATHYFELISLAEEVAGIKNMHFDATEHGDKIIFMHVIQEGPANRSYGIQVAQLAGLPRSVIQRAKQKLTSLELEKVKPLAHDCAVEQPSLLSKHPVLDLLASINPDQLSPREALEWIYQLKCKSG
ncbi:MAG TPA: DNA mismatch repair protein MutS, partial [Gammaproteobacteria bacterium]|nr:DNA mismatch repair protein MutS [Gammaproteobacteria bacterium]